MGRCRKPLSGDRLAEVEAVADDLLEAASGAAAGRDVRIMSKALGWPPPGSTRPGVKWATRDRNHAECWEGDTDHRGLERLRAKGYAAEDVRWKDGQLQYKITPLGIKVAYLRHMAFRAAKALS